MIVLLLCVCMVHWCRAEDFPYFPAVPWGGGQEYDRREGGQQGGSDCPGMVVCEKNDGRVSSEAVERASAVVSREKNSNFVILSRRRKKTRLLGKRIRKPDRARLTPDTATGSQGDTREAEINLNLVRNELRSRKVLPSNYRRKGSARDDKEESNPEESIMMRSGLRGSMKENTSTGRQRLLLPVNFIGGERTVKRRKVAPRPEFRPNTKAILKVRVKEVPRKERKEEETGIEVSGHGVSGILSDIYVRRKEPSFGRQRVIRKKVSTLRLHREEHLGDAGDEVDDGRVIGSPPRGKYITGRKIQGNLRKRVKEGDTEKYGVREMEDGGEMVEQVRRALAQAYRQAEVTIQEDPFQGSVLL